MRLKKFSMSLTLGLLLIGFNSCDDSRLDVKPGTVTEDAYFVEEVEFERAIYGTYAKLTDFYWYNAGGNNSVQPVTLLPGDDITTGGQDGFEIFSNINPGNGQLGYFYTALYQLIGRANVVLQKNAQVKDGVYVTAGLKNSHRGEALFLRAYGHYMLWNLFGTAPVRNERLVSLDNTKAPSSTGTQLLDQAITDLKEAVTLLPATWDANNTGRVTKNSANGLLGKSLVFRGTVNKANADFTDAIVAFTAISGRSLVAAFDDNFAFDTENNSESLFEYQATQAFGFDNVWLSNDFDNAIGALSVFWGYYNNHWSLFGKQPFKATTKLANLYEVGDPRKNFTTNGALEIKKYVTRDKLNQPGQSSVNNPRILRYADVLLLKAEALNESGGSTAEAIGLINQVRTRARGAGTAPVNLNIAITDRAQIRQLLMNERLMEFAGEGQRWFDLRRWSLGGQLVLNNAFFDSALPTNMGFVAEKHINFPIPTGETNVNPNIIQNAGY